MELALDGINAYKNWKEYLGDNEAGAYFTQTDALWMVGKTEADNIDCQRRLAKYGVKSDILNRESFIEKFPLMNPDPFPKYDANFDEIDQTDQLGSFSSLFEEGCGHLDS